MDSLTQVAVPVSQLLQQRIYYECDLKNLDNGLALLEDAYNIAIAGKSTIKDNWHHCYVVDESNGKTVIVVLPCPQIQKQLPGNYATDAEIAELYE